MNDEPLDVAHDAFYTKAGLARAKRHVRKARELLAQAEVGELRGTAPQRSRRAAKDLAMARRGST
jgi:hypothetical protein